MAAIVQLNCVQCSQNIDKQADKVIKCYRKCNNVLHYTCSTFKPSELKFMEANIHNIRWCCNDCASESVEESVSILKRDLASIDKKIEILTKIIYEQNEKLTNQDKIIHNRIVTKEVQKQTAVEEELQGPSTRSKTIDVSTEWKSYAKTTSTIQGKKHKQTPEKNSCPPKNEDGLRDDKTTTQGKTSINTKATTNFNNANKTKTIRGKRLNTKILAADSQKWIFVSQLAKDTAVDDVKQYLIDNQMQLL